MLRSNIGFGESNKCLVIIYVVGALHQMVECHQFLRDNIGFKKKTPPAPTESFFTSFVDY